MKSERISAFLQSRIEAKDFPSAVYVVAEKGNIVFQDALGFAVVEPERVEANLNTIYDLASLTKVLVTGLLCAKLIEDNEINLSDKISKYFIEFDTKDKREITIENLLKHTSGFLAWQPLYLVTDARSQIVDFISRAALKDLPNAQVTYSDLNFQMLTFLLENIHNISIDKIAHRKIFEPLNLQNTFYNPSLNLHKRIAASEHGNEYEKQMCANLGFDVERYDWRNYQIWGEVHDGNCYFMNGVSGHAGLFSNALETFKIAQQFLANQTILLKPETCELFRTNFTPNLNEARSIAFQLAATKDSTAGENLAKDSFGHLGFTGTSLWIEPSTERIFILLTNRTHHDLPLANINAVRREFHNFAAVEMNEISNTIDNFTKRL